MGGLHSEVIALVFLILLVCSTSPIQAGTGDLRLVGSTSSSGGRLEIYINGEWGTVCDDYFGSTEVTVACRQLGFGGHIRNGNVDTLGYPQGTGRIWLDDVVCPNSSTPLLECAHLPVGRHNCAHSKDVAIECVTTNQITGDLRLVGSSSGGRLEILVNGEWGTVCDDGFSIIDATAACRQLGFAGFTRNGNVGSLGYIQGTGRIWLDDVDCPTSSTQLLQCSHRTVGSHNCVHSEDVALECSNSSTTSSPSGAIEGSLRLVGTSSGGRLEIYVRGEWGTVCDDGFGSTEATAACRQLGFTGSTRNGNVITLRYRQGVGRIWLDDVDCLTSSTPLLQCSHRTVGSHNCVHSEDVALECSNSSSTSPTSSPSGAIEGSLRLVGTLSGGRLEIYVNGEWGTVCDDDFGIIDATAACRQLGFTGFTRNGNVGSLGYIQGTGRIWLDNVNCPTSSTPLLQCSHNGLGNHNCGHNEDVALECSTGSSSLGDLRLVGSRSGGRLEIYYNGEWGTVCDDGFGRTEANAACRQLGFDRATRRGNVLSLGYSQGSGRIWLDNVNCLTSNTHLLDCGHNTPGVHNCAHSEDVALVCGTTGSSASTGSIIGGIIGSLVLLGFCGFFFYVCIGSSSNNSSWRSRRRRRRQNRRTVVPSRCTLVAISHEHEEDMPSASNWNTAEPNYYTSKPQDSFAAYPANSQLQTAPPPSYDDAIKSYPSLTVGGGAYPSPAMVTEYPQPQISSQYPGPPLPGQHPDPVHPLTEPQRIPAPYPDAARPQLHDSSTPYPHEVPQNLPPPDNSGTSTVSPPSS